MYKKYFHRKAYFDAKTIDTSFLDTLYTSILKEDKQTNRESEDKGPPQLAEGAVRL